MKLSKKWLLLAAPLLGLALTAGACGAPSGQAQENSAQNNLSGYYNQVQPLPGGGKPSGMRDTLIAMENAQIDNKASTSFFFSFANVDPIFVCPSLGTPIAASSSLSNPDQISWTGSGGGYGVIAQMDPNGVYTPPTTTATYVRCVGPGGIPEFHIAEGDVHTVFGPAHWDYGKHQIVIG